MKIVNLLQFFFLINLNTIMYQILKVRDSLSCGDTC